MNRNLHVLVTSISKKVPLIKAVRKALHFFGPTCRLFGADSNANCIGQYFVDHFWHSLKIEDLSKWDILEYCKKHDIRAIIPTRNEELLFWSEMEEFLCSNQIHVMVSPLDSLKNCLDKFLFYDCLTKTQIKTPDTAMDLSKLKGDLFVVKERNGAGSKGIGLKLTKEAALNHAKTLQNPIFQSFIPGPEYSVDLYITKTGLVNGVIARKRLLVVEGESQITETVTHKDLEELSKKAALKLSLKGHVLFQIIQSEIDKSYSIIECNPRFGGASTLSILAGLDSFRWFFHEALHEKLPTFKRSPNEIRLVRHAEDTSFSL